MDSPGEYLKTERESRNIALREVSKSTKIREPLLQAIENDRYDLLAGPVYMKGFLEAYAKYLGLEPDDVILRYQRFMEGRTLPKEPLLEHRLTSKKRRISLWFLLVLAFVLSLGVSIFFFSFPPMDHFKFLMNQVKSVLKTFL